jgi:hypothetical protein
MATPRNEAIDEAIKKVEPAPEDLQRKVRENFVCVGVIDNEKLGGSVRVLLKIRKKEEFLPMSGIWIRR